MKWFAFLCLLLCAVDCHAGERVALVIGNGSYQRLQKLTACPLDAARMAETFQKVGIRVHGGKPLIDLTATQMDRALNEFANSLGKDSEAFIYYSGHGAQFGGSNYLLPVGFDAEYESEARRQAVSLDTILELLERSDSRLRVVILDACRDPGNLLPGEPKQKGVVRKGLSEQRVEAPETLVCFATKHGQPSFAGDNASYYTEVLAEEMLKPAEIGAMMRKVANRVYVATEKRQLPFTYGSLLQEHYLRPAAADVSPAAEAPAPSTIPAPPEPVATVPPPAPATSSPPAGTMPPGRATPAPTRKPANVAKTPQNKAPKSTPSKATAGTAQNPGRKQQTDNTQRMLDQQRKELEQAQRESQERLRRLRESSSKLPN